MFLGGAPAEGAFGSVHSLDSESGPGLASLVPPDSEMVLPGALSPSNGSQISSALWQMLSRLSGV